MQTIILYVKVLKDSLKKAGPTQNKHTVYAKRSYKLTLYSAVLKNTHIMLLEVLRKMAPETLNLN